MKDDERPDDVKFLEGLLVQGVEHHRPHVADAVLTLSFLSGNQWVKVSKSRGILPIENAANEIRVTQNRMIGVYRRRQYYLFKDRPVITAFEGGNELADAERASVASKLCDYWRSNCGWEEAEKEASSWVDICGLAFIAPVWRKRSTMKKPVARLEFSNEPVASNGKKSFLRKKQSNEIDGELAFDVYHSLNTYCFPLKANKWGKVEGVLTADLCSREWLENSLGRSLAEEELKPIRPEELNLEALETINRYVSTEFGLMQAPEEEKQFMLLQWRERPTLKHPNGRYIIVAGGNLIHSGPLPYLDEVREIDPTDEYNLTMGLVPWSSMEFPGRMIPPSIFGMLRQPQIQLNDLLTDEAANRKTVGRNKILFEEGTISEDAMTGEHGEMIPVRGTAGRMAPTLIQGQPLVGVANEIERANRSFDETAGETGVLRGENPAQVRAAFHLDILREESLTMLFGDSLTREKVHEKVAKIALALAKRRYSKDRIISIYGRDQAGRALTYKTANILADIRVKEGSARPRNHAAREAKLVELLHNGAFMGPDGKPDMRSFWEMSELGTFNRAVTTEQKQRNRAREETARMLYGEIIQPWDHEDHDIHLEEHLGEMARPEWYAASDEIKANMLAHIQFHELIRAKQLAPEAFMGGSGAVPGVVEGAMAAAAPQGGFNPAAGSM